MATSYIPKTAIIPAAGTSHSKVLPVSSDIPDIMIPINGKPVVAYLIPELAKQGFLRVIIVVKKTTPSLMHYLEVVKGSLDIEIVEIPQTKTLLESILAGFDKVIEDGALIILGDTLCFDKLTFNYDFVYYQDRDDPFRWCIVEPDRDAVINKLLDKPVAYPVPAKALIGVYNILDKSLFKKVFATLSTIHSDVPLSAVLSEYSRHRPIISLKSKQWYDCGSPDTYFSTKKNLLSSRSFNHLNFNEDFGSIRKESKHADKLRDEIEWYVNLPEKLKIFTPRVIDYSLGQNPFIEQEYYGYQTLSELFLFHELSPYLWDHLLRYISKVVDLFGEYKSNSFAEQDLYEMYLNKTVTRVNLAKSNNNRIFDVDELIINDKNYDGWSNLSKRLEAAIPDLYSPEHFQIIHGDFCFSNILCDPNNRIIKFIDPRGRFSKKGLYGDVSYEWAKLRHSTSGYDLIINDLFNVHGSGNQFTLNLYHTQLQLNIKENLDRIIKEHIGDVHKIKIVEGCLFVSMVPYHPENRKRQDAMALLGIYLLNEGLNAIGY